QARPGRGDDDPRGRDRAGIRSRRAERGGTRPSSRRPRHDGARPRALTTGRPGRRLSVVVEDPDSLVLNPDLAVLEVGEDDPVLLRLVPDRPPETPGGAPVLVVGLQDLPTDD